MVFDEVDQGVGGAVADAVGSRLKRLAETAQVLVVTHSPQVAARADAHWRVSKRTRGEHVSTAVEALAPTAREEEIARMLAGAEVTGRRPRRRPGADRRLGSSPFRRRRAVVNTVQARRRDTGER
jgi:DNA repair protein RecN (Recombination protein N)